MRIWRDRNKDLKIKGGTYQNNVRKISREREKLWRDREGK